MALCLPPNLAEARRAAVAILADADLLQTCADASSLHRNGFTKVVVVDSPTGGRTRLHFWPGDFARSGTGSDGEDIHSHRWPFSSLVLSGVFREHLYQVTPGGPDLVGRYSKHDPGRKLTSVEPVSITEFDCRAMKRGKRMSRRPGLFHRLVHEGDRPGMTLVRTAPAERGYSYVARQAGQGIDVDPGRGVDPISVERILVAFLSLEALAA